jgi:hypothetical protein
MYLQSCLDASVVPAGKTPKTVRIRNVGPRIFPRTAIDYHFGEPWEPAGSIFQPAVDNLCRVEYHGNDMPEVRYD